MEEVRNMDEDLKILKEIQKKHREELKIQRQKYLDRKKRTRSLIIKGAISQKALSYVYCDIERIDEDEYQNRMYEIVNYYLSHHDSGIKQP